MGETVEGGAQDPRVALRDIAVDPFLQVASGSFATWTGVILVDDAGDALVLRRSGDEDRVSRDETRAAAIEAHAGAPVGSGVWLPLAVLQPVLGRLSPADAFDVLTRLPAPRVERIVADGPPHRPVELRAGLVDGLPGWCGIAALH